MHVWRDVIPLELGTLRIPADGVKLDEKALVLKLQRMWGKEGVRGHYPTVMSATTARSYACTELWGVVLVLGTPLNGENQLLLHENQ